MIEVFSGYIEHNDTKSEGKTGFLNRKYMEIDNNSIHYIGKESNELEKSEFIGISKQTLWNVKNKINNLQFQKISYIIKNRLINYLIFYEIL